MNNNSIVIDWTKADDSCIQSYMQTLDSMLRHINIPVDVLGEGGESGYIKFKIDAYYASLMPCVMKACCTCLPVRRANPATDYVVPGWNDIVSDKHKLARDAYMVWSMAGKPRSGPEHWLMKRTRAQFKLAIRYCKQHEDTVRSNMYATALINKDYNKFWSDMRKSSNDRSTLHATSVGGCNGDGAITEMWQLHLSSYIIVSVTMKLDIQFYSVSQMVLVSVLMYLSLFRRYLRHVPNNSVVRP